MTRIIECEVSNEYVKNAGVMVGAAGSHHDVVLRLKFGEMWDGLNITIVWLNSRGLNPVYTILTSAMKVDDRTYDVPIPAEPKEFEGRMCMTIKGTTVSGNDETRATLSVAADFIVMPSRYDRDAAEEADPNPTIADQLQAQISQNTAARHTHSNKSTLDTITAALISVLTDAAEWITAHGQELISHISDSIRHITSTERSTWNAKQNAISDLATIRSGAALGATAVQPAELADYVEEPPEEGTPGYVLATDGEGGRYWKAAGGGGGGTGDYPDLTNKPRINGVELIGDKTGDDLGFPTEEETEAAIDAVVSAHNSDSSAHSELINSHNSDSSAHSGLFNALSSIYAAISHNHSAANITSGTLPVARGGTGAASFTANCAIVSGSSTTAALTTRAITNLTAKGAVTGSTNLATANTVLYHVQQMLNRTATVNAADTAYTTYKARGEALFNADTNPTVNGTISWTYK